MQYMLRTGLYLRLGLGLDRTLASTYVLCQFNVLSLYSGFAWRPRLLDLVGDQIEGYKTRLVGYLS